MKAVLLSLLMGGVGAFAGTLTLGDVTAGTVTFTAGSPNTMDLPQSSVTGELDGLGVSGSWSISLLGDSPFSYDDSGNIIAGNPAFFAIQAESLADEVIGSLDLSSIVNGTGDAFDTATIYGTMTLTDTAFSGPDGNDFENELVSTLGSPLAIGTAFNFQLLVGDCNNGDSDTSCMVTGELDPTGTPIQATLSLAAPEPGSLLLLGAGLFAISFAGPFITNRRPRISAEVW